MKLILLDGFAGIGKTTLAHKYIAVHPLTMAIEGDEIMNMIGKWREHEPEARVIKLKHVTALIDSHLQTGNDVILPYLVTDASHIAQFEKMAQGHGATFYEIYLSTNKDDATKRLLDRGRWGEAGSKILTEDDIPNIESLYELMESELQKRPSAVHVESKDGESEKTYFALLKILGEQ